MALSTATGGSVYLAAATILPVGSWQGTWRSILANVTQSDCGGGTVYFGTNQDPSWSYSVCRDDTAYPESLGFTSGAFLSNVYFKLGGENKADHVTNTTVETVETVNDVQTGEVIRVTVSGKGGKVTPNASLPS